jgi:hypothetical protein
MGGGGLNSVAGGGGLNSVAKRSDKGRAVTKILTEVSGLIERMVISLLSEVVSFSRRKFVIDDMRYVLQIVAWWRCHEYGLLVQYIL